MATGKSWMNWYSITTRKIGTTFTTTSGTESTTMWTPMTTLTTGRHSTSTIAWRFTTCTSTERARVVLFLVQFIHTHIGSTSSLVRTSPHHHGHPRERSLFTLILSALYFPAFLLSVFLFSFFLLSDEQQPELNQKIMENLRYSATNGCEGTYDVLYLPTGYELNGHDFNELQNSSVLLQDPCRGPRRGWPDTRRDAHWSIPRRSRLLRTRRRFSQSVVLTVR